MLQPFEPAVLCACVSFNCSAYIYIVDASRLYIEIAEENHEARLIYHSDKKKAIYTLLQSGMVDLVKGEGGGWNIFPLMGSYLIEY